MIITYKGEQCSTADISRMAGITHSTLMGRLKAGWDIDRAVTTPVNVAMLKGPEKRTKNMATIYLDEKPIVDLPPEMRHAIHSGYKIGRIGTYLRTHHKHIFDQWYYQHFLSEKLDSEKEPSTASS